MKVIQSPDEHLRGTFYQLFLAGGISNCPNWQSDIITLLDEFLTYKSVTIFNPRRVGDLAKNGEDAEAQILWEHRYLNNSTDILFWFPKETVCPITLFELGKYAQYYSKYYDTVTTKPEDHLHIGVHPNYSRKFDLEIQIPLIIPNITIHYSLEDLAVSIANRWNK